MTILNYLNDLECYFPYKYDHTTQTPLVIQRPLNEAHKRRRARRALPNGQYLGLPLAGCRMPIDPFLYNSKEGKILRGILEKLVETKVIEQDAVSQYLEKLQNKLLIGTCAGETFAVNIATATRNLFHEELDVEQQQRLAMCVHIFNAIIKDIGKKALDCELKISCIKNTIESKKQELEELQKKRNDLPVESLCSSLNKMSLEKSAKERTVQLAKKIQKKFRLKDDMKDMIFVLNKMKSQLSNLTTIIYDKAELRMKSYKSLPIKKETESDDIAKIVHDIDAHTKSPRNYSILLSLSYKGADTSSHRISIQINPLELYDLKIGKVAYDSKEALYKDLENYFKHYNVTGVGLKIMSKTISMRE